MKALIFGSEPPQEQPRAKPRDELDERLYGLPFGLHEVDEAHPLRPDWVVVRPTLSGICGSDSKLVLGDFSEEDVDNPMAAFSSLPNVPGHETVCKVETLGPEAEGLEVGQRVVLNPWLTCAPRGVEPLCGPCRRGDFPLCESFTTGELGPGVHIGVTAGVPGAWAEQFSAHDSMLIAVPDSISDEAAVLADPFSVSFHAIVRNPPPESGRVVVYGAGALGLASVATLRALYPEVEVAVVARFKAQAETARRFGAALVVAHEPTTQVVDELAHWSGGVLHAALAGLPMTRPGYIDVVYDTIAKPETFEVSVRVLAERGKLVYTGVATPGRWEWTPVYFKELTVVGSNAFGIETLDGVRRHAISHYLDLVAEGRLDITDMLTHKYPLEQWPLALRALADQGSSGALKVAFEPNAAT
ncbi:MAG: alcohol dehydrogenase catalytic domain-containing protein [Actinobacteria bacterium]|nr:alcohol dehydrogenase catalytic domain-containing protein [Actinomycetota bacterium]MCL5444590.1 alcohol dehydrogenase catalytic domain-containing protein [Actinomycetota bacterium]